MLMFILVNFLNPKLQINFAYSVEFGLIMHLFPMFYKCYSLIYIGLNSLSAAI